MIVYLRFARDYLWESKRFESKKAAIEYFADTARELARYEQKIEASLHVGRSIEKLDEYPDFILSLGPRGGVVCERVY